MKVTIVLVCTLLLWTRARSEDERESVETLDLEASVSDDADDIGGEKLTEKVGVGVVEQRVELEFVENEGVKKETSESIEKLETETERDNGEKETEEDPLEDRLAQEDIPIDNTMDSSSSSEESLTEVNSSASDASSMGEALDEELESKSAPESFMGIVAPARSENDDDDDSAIDPDNHREEASLDSEGSESNAKRYLLSYQTFLSWFIEKIRPETESDFGTSEPSAESRRRDDGSKGTSEAEDAASESSNETTQDSRRKSASLNSSSTPVEGAAEQNESSKCSGFGCILKLNQKAKAIKCAPRNMTTLERKREGATLDDLTRVHIFQSQVGH